MAGGASSLDAMDVYEATTAVFARVHGLDPDNASKIMGMLLIRDGGERELIRLAFGPDHLLLAFVAAARAELAAKPPSPPSPSPARAPWGMLSPGAHDHAPPLAAGDHGGYDAGEALHPEDYDGWSPAGAAHRRSLSLSDAEAAAWRPCLYYARGFCKNGAACRFLHGLPDDDPAAAAEREVLVMRARALAAARSPQLAPPAPPFSPVPKGLAFLLHQQQQQQGDPQRAAAMLLGGDDMHRFAVRSPRMLDRGELMASPAARQIYLTFPADSTFTEEDVSNYFSKFGPVQDVRIPHQQKRMFGFVTFVYPETVKIILAKGNPHFVCDARVLVKPYKEKGKVPDKYRKLQHPHHGEFAACTTPTGMLDCRDPFDLQQPQIGPRMMYGNNAVNHDAFLRRKLEEQQQEAELQQAIELQGRRFMGLQLLDLKSRGHHHLGSPVDSPMFLGQRDGNDNLNGNGNAVDLDDVTLIQDNKLNSSHAMSAPASSGISAIASEGKHEDQQDEDADGTPKQAVNPGEEKRESGPGAAAPKVACGFQESGVEHNLPDSPFASPTKASIHTAATAQNGDIYNTSPHHVASSLFPPTSSSLELPPYSSCFFQVPRGSPLGMKPLGYEYRAKRGLLSSMLGRLMTPSCGGRVENFNKN
ncbi:hypothetical protein ACP4OV_003324 [Aristida adscensionis]